MSKELKQLQQQYAQLSSQLQGAISKQNAPDPNVEALRSYNNNILNWYTDTSKPRDIYNHPVLGGDLPILQSALAGHDQNRVGTGVLGANMKSATSSPYTADLAEERDFKRHLAGANMIDTALSGQRDQAENNLMNLTGVDAQRQNSSNSLLSGMYNATAQRLGQADQKPGFWTSLVGGLASGAGSLVTALKGI